MKFPNTRHQFSPRGAFAIHCLAVGLMLLTPLLMYIAAQLGASVWYYPLLGGFVFANLMELSIP